MKTRLLVIFAGLAIVILLSLSACDLFKPGPGPTATFTPAVPPATFTPQPTPLPTRPFIGYTPVPPEAVSPVVIQRSPETGEEVAPGGAIQLVFDRAMDRASVEAAFAIQPAVTGKFEWRDARTLLFRPGKPLARGMLYDVSLDQKARAADGAPLRSAYQFRFATAGYLQVGQVMPAPESVDVETHPRITVIFNRPVVPLTSLGEQKNLPQPLTFAPAVSGKGEWLNTSIYVFVPDKPLAGGTTYTVRVSGVQDTDGNPMEADYTWRFTTQPPKVVWVTPSDRAKQVPIETAIRVQFNQPIDAASAQQAFSARIGRNKLTGAFEITGDTLVFTPTTRLPFDAGVEIVVAAGVKSAAGGEGMRQDFGWHFWTVPLPRVDRTDPADGNMQANPYTSFTIYFNTRIDPKTVMPNIQMVPPLSPTQVYTYYGDTGFTLSFGAQPATEYYVKIGPNIADPYGNKTGQTLFVRFRTANLDPTLHLQIPDYIGTYSAYELARVYVAYVNVRQADLKLYRLTMDDLTATFNWYSYDYQPPASKLVRQWSKPLEVALNKLEYAPIDITEKDGPLAPGLYLLDVSAPGLPEHYGRWGLRHLMVVSKYNLTLKAAPGQALVWATDLKSGQPVQGLRLRFYNSDWKASGEATSDASGVAQASLPRQDSIMVALSDEPFALVYNGWSRGISPWEFGLSGEYPAEYRAHIYTDRPIYRPGQMVYFRGILRAEKDVRYSLPRGRQVHVTISSPSGEQVLDKNLSLDDYGVFDGEVKLTAGAALGSYYIQVQLQAPDSSGTMQQWSFNASFQVAAYRPPEFEVIVTPAQTEVVRGQTVGVDIQTKYFAGGALAGAPINWNVIAQDYSFTPAWGGGYSFRDVDDPWLCFDCWWRRYTPPRQVVLSGSGVTDENGSLRLEISDVKFQTPVTGSQQLIIEATAVGADNQYISGRATVVAHAGDYYIGLAADKYVGKAGEPFKVNLVAVDWRGDNPRLAGKTVAAQIYRREWKNVWVEKVSGSGYWTSEKIDTLVDTQSVTTNERGEATISFTPPQGGSYKILARDPQSLIPNTSSLFVWIAGQEYVAWWRENNDRINLIADKVNYMPGETAEVLIPSPYQGLHYALVTIERGGLLKYEVVQMTSNSQVYRVPLTADYVPNVYVSVVLIKGVDATQKIADYKVGIVPLMVKPTAQTLNVTLTPDPAQGEPGKSIVYTLRATDVTGQPVSAEFSLDLVDKAVLMLMPRQKDAIVQEFYGKRGLGVQTSSGLAVSVNRWLLELEQDVAQRELAMWSGGMPLATAEPLAAKGVAPAPSMADGEAYKSAEAVPPGVQIRQEFADTAYWNASVVTDKDGKATVTVKLPDNLTTWVMRGVGVTADTRVGEGIVELVSTKPLMIRPVTPRFFVVGDRAQLAALVNNNTDAALQATVALSATGVTLDTPAVQTVAVPARGEVKLTWNVVVQDVTQTDLVFWAVAGEYNDASKPRLATGPDGSLLVLRYSAPDIVGTAGDLPQAGSRTEVIALPPKYDGRQGELSIQLDPSLAAAMQDGLDYLEHYEYECTEQTVSRFLPNVLTYRALKELGIRDSVLEAKLPKLVQEGLDKLYSQQRDDGGWGWWYDSKESNVHLTAYVVFALIKAQQAGFEVRADVIQRGEQFMIGKLVQARELTSFGTANRQAFILYVLAEGNPQYPIPNIQSYLTDLFTNRDKLSHYGKAYLALAMGLTNPSDARIATLLADLNNAAILSATGAHWEESNYDWWAMNTDTRSTAIILDALARLDKDNQLAPNVVRWLMVARKGGYWETTQETAWALIALTDWMKATGELQGNYDYAVFLNEKDLASGQVDSGKVESRKLKVAVADLLQESNRLTIARGDGAGRLYYTAHLRVFLPVEEIAPVSRGITVIRRYTLASCTDGPKCPEVREAKLGDVIRVDLTIIAPNDLYYVMVEDPLPAGGEAIDTGLATTSLLAQDPSLRREPAGEGKSYWWDYYWWWWRWYSRSELRDEKVVLFADYLPKGTYEYSYTFRATLPGDYQVIPTVASEFYFPEVFGRSAGRLLSIGQ